MKDSEKVLGNYPDLQAWREKSVRRWHRIPSFQAGNHLNHLALICDGNRRAAEERGFEPYLGHYIGIEVVKQVAAACSKWGIKHLSMWLWSTENWARDNAQVDFILNLGRESLEDRNFIDRLHRQQVKLTHLGRKDRLPMDIVQTLRNLEESTRSYSQYFLNLAIDYGGIDEVARAIQKIAQQDSKKAQIIQSLQEDPTRIRQYLDTEGQPDTDLVVRTGYPNPRTYHTSGFMPLQTTYSRYMFIPDLFPNLRPSSLLRCIRTFNQEDRKFGR